MIMKIFSRKGGGAYQLVCVVNTKANSLYGDNYQTGTVVPGESRWSNSWSTSWSRYPTTLLLNYQMWCRCYWLRVGNPYWLSSELMAYLTFQISITVYHYFGNANQLILIPCTLATCVDFSPPFWGKVFETLLVDEFGLHISPSYRACF